MRRHLVIGSILLVSVLAVYGQVIRHDFVNLDDNDYLYQNGQVQNGLTWQGIQWAFTTMTAGNWHPVTWLSHMVDYQLFGPHAGSHHLVSVFLHFLNSFLLYLLLYGMTGMAWRGAVVALLFAVHPLHVESVAWAAERKDVLSTLFFMLMLLSYAWYSKQPSMRRYGLVFGCLALGLMAKPMLMTAPFVLLLLDYWPLERLWVSLKTAPTNGTDASRRTPEGPRSNLIGLLVEKIPLFVLIIASGVVTFFAQHQGKATTLNFVVSLGHRILNAFVSYGAYLANMVWPSGLSAYYPYRIEITTVQWIGALLAIIALSVVAVVMARRSKYLIVGWLWYVGTLVPVIGFVQVGEQAMADRYTYIPSIGIFLAAVWGVAELAAGLRHSRVVCAIAAGAVSCVYMAIAGVQVGYWNNSVTLFEHALAVTADNAAAHINLGQALELRGRVDEAIVQYKKVLSRWPGQPVALTNLGSALTKQGKLDEAARLLGEALASKPENADAHSNLGFTLMQQGRLEEAIDHFQQAIKLNPRRVEAYNNLGTARERQGKLDEALEHFRTALTIDPKQPEALNNVGVILIKRGKLDEAVAHFREVVHIIPNNAQAHNNLAIVLAHQGKLDDAIAQFREVVRIDPAFPEAQHRLGVLLSQQGKQGNHQ